MTELAKILGLVVASGLKFFLAPTALILAGYSFFETIAITVFGGIAGFFFFYKFGKIVQRFIKRLFPKSKKRLFTKRNRFIVKIKVKYGLYGIAILTPCVFGIPLGAVLASIFYSKDKKTPLLLTVSIVIWSFILTSLTSFFAE